MGWGWWGLRVWMGHKEQHCKAEKPGVIFIVGRKC
jgi:hypothetical protein